MTDMLWRVQVAAASAVAKGQKGGGEKVPGDENDSSEVAVRKAIDSEKESAQHVARLEKYSVRMPDHEQVALSVFQKVWAHVATDMNVAGCPQFPHPESLLGVEGYTRKYKSGGVEAGNEAGAGLTINFRKEKVYASSTTTQPEKLDTANKAVAALMSVRALDCGHRGCGGFAFSHRAPHLQQPWGCGVKGELREPSSARRASDRVVEVRGENKRATVGAASQLHVEKGERSQ